MRQLEGTAVNSQKLSVILKSTVWSICLETYFSMVFRWSLSICQGKRYQKTRQIDRCWENFWNSKRKVSNQHIYASHQATITRVISSVPYQKCQKGKFFLHCLFNFREHKNTPAVTIIKAETRPLIS